MNDTTLVTAVKLAEKIQHIRTMGDSIGVIIGRTSIAQAVQNVRRQAAQLVFSIQNDEQSTNKMSRLKELQGGLLGLQVYGVISEKELEDYMLETDKIHDLIESN